MKRSYISLLCCLGILLGSMSVSEAGIRAPGKYCGVVIFDRWGGCTLYSGIYVMYISEKVKDDLQPYAGQAIQIDAKEVYQPMNPGDGRIGKFEYLGPAPKTQNWIVLEGIHLYSSVKVGDDGKAIATITVENKGEAPVKMFSGELALTLLMKRDVTKQDWFAPDGPSVALITRQSFEIGGETPRWEGKGVNEGQPYAWTIGEENALPHDFILAPNQKRNVDVQFDLPDGEYDFLCGYGGGTHGGVCLASNLSAFDVKDGKATPVSNAQKASFESFSVALTSTWPWNRTITIRSDGSYTFDMNQLKPAPGGEYFVGDEKHYVTEYTLSPDHLRTLDRLVAATDWLANAGKVNENLRDAMRYTMTVRRDGKEQQTVCYGEQEEAYADLIRFLRRVNRQEWILYQLASGRADTAQGLHNLNSELSGMLGRPGAMNPYAPALDYDRLRPAVERVAEEGSPAQRRLAAETLRLMDEFKVEEASKAN